MLSNTKTITRRRITLVVAWMVTVQAATAALFLLLLPTACHADIPTEALEALGRQHEREMRKKDTKRNRQKAALEMVIEHPGIGSGSGLFFDQQAGDIELNPEYQKAQRKKNRNANSNNNRHQYDDDFIVFQQFHHHQHNQHRQQQGLALHEQLVHGYDAASPGPVFASRGNTVGSLLGLQRPLAAAEAPVPPITQSLQYYFQSMLEHSPTTFAMTFACVVVFLLWQAVPTAPWLRTYFVCGRDSFRQSHGLSLLLSNVSHNSLRHLAVNLLTLFHLAPKLWSSSSSSSGNTTARVADLMSATSRKRKSSAATTTTTGPASLSPPLPPLWPLLWGSAIFTNSLFVAFYTTKTCLGLSGVVMAMMAYYYGGIMGDTTQPLQFLIGGILPISLRPHQLIRILLGVSLVGSFSTRSTIAHLVHLGGLIFGLLYYHGMQQAIVLRVARTGAAKQREAATRPKLFGVFGGRSSDNRWY